MTRTDTGILIAVEGIDGAGKTTQVALLEEFLTSTGESVIRSKEPTDGPWGRAIRESATTVRLPLSDELRHFTEDRREHVRDRILPALERGNTVILDRYFYSTISYQGARGNNIEGLTAQMLAIAPVPDAVILLDLPPELGLIRIAESRGETPNTFENLDNLKTVRRIFLQLAESHKEIVKIDGTQSVESTQKSILHSLLDGIFKKRHCAKPWGCDDPYNCAYRITGECRWAKMRQRAGVLS